MKDDRLYLIHISECIARIESYTTGGRDAFTQSTLIQDAVIRNLQVMGESAKRLSQETKAKHPDVEWRGASGLRNVLVHDYLGIDLDTVWDVLEKDLPLFKQAISQLLADAQGGQ